MDATAIAQLLQQAVPGAAVDVEPAVDQPTLSVTRASLREVCRTLREAPVLQFSLLAEITAVDWLGREPRFEVVYHLASLGGLMGRREGPSPQRLRLKVRVPSDDPRVPSVADLWPSANWSEREVWDLFGIVFDGHPDLRRLLMPDDWEGHPLRKDYPVQIDLATKTYEPLQVSEEEFVATIAAARRRTHVAPADRPARPLGASNDDDR